MDGNYSFNSAVIHKIQEEEYYSYKHAEKQTATPSDMFVLLL